MNSHPTWKYHSCLDIPASIQCLSWDKDSRLLVGGTELSLWQWKKETKSMKVTQSLNEVVQDDNLPISEEASSDSKTLEIRENQWMSLWKCTLASEVTIARFSPDSRFFATCAQVKLSDRISLLFFIVTLKFALPHHFFSLVIELE